MGSQKQPKEKEYVKSTNVTVEEANIEILLLENLLREFESSHGLRPQVNDLIFSNFDEEMRFLE